MSGWRPALRIARRSVRRNLKRSILIAALIAVPIAGATVVDGLLRTLTDAERELYEALGEADGAATVTGLASLPGWEPGAHPALFENGAPDERDRASVDVSGMLPPGTRAVAGRSYQGLRLREGGRIVRTSLQLFAIGDPLTAHEGRLVAGRLPAGPEEALVTEPLAERLGVLDGDEVRPGATITADDGPTVAVTGVAIDPHALSTQAVIALPGSALAAAARTYGPVPPVYYVDLPANVDVDELGAALAEHGVAFRPRAVYTDAGRDWAAEIVRGDPLETVGPVALVVGFGVLEVVLLAGAAFAVGARRQVRELGLIGANGGTARHVRRVVLAQGLFLGAVGAVGGLVLGWVLLVAGTPLWERLTDTLVDGWRFGWIELTVAASVGVLSGLAAALLPAVGVARMAPVDALAQRFRTTARTARLPILGVVLLGTGIAGVLGSGVLAQQAVTEYLEMLRTDLDAQPDLMLPTIGVLVGGFAAVAGVVMLTSGLVAALGRIGWRLPLSGRLAVRDAGRHRHRTVPAVTAIMIVVTASVALAFSVAASSADEVQTVPDDTIVLLGEPLPEQSPAAFGEELREGAAAVTAELPGAVSQEIPMVEQPGPTQEARTPVIVGMSGTTSGTCSYDGSWVGIGTPEMIEMATGSRPSRTAMSALADGEVLVLDECMLEGAAVTTDATGTGGEPVRLPARHVAKEEGTMYGDLPGAFISAETANAHGWTTRVTSYAVTHDGTASEDDIDAALTAAEDSGLNTYLETDDAAQTNLVALGLAAGAGLVTLLGVGITVALSAAEGRADLATLAAIGAQPRRRRTLAGAQALVLSGLGTVLGLLVGGALGLAMVPLTGQTEVVLPWPHLGITAVAVPLLAVAVAMLSTRSNLPMVRRVD